MTHSTLPRILEPVPGVRLIGPGYPVRVGNASLPLQSAKRLYYQLLDAEAADIFSDESAEAVILYRAINRAACLAHGVPVGRRDPGDPDVRARLEKRMRDYANPVPAVRKMLAASVAELRGAA